MSIPVRFIAQLPGIFCGAALTFAIQLRSLTRSQQTQLDCDLCGGESRIRINAVDPSKHLRDDNVNSSVSLVSSVPRVREILGEKMRGYARLHDVVMEGRDIGSAVFPETPFKFYIDASPDVRARRREAQGERDEITSRDRIDSSRQTAPLMIAADAAVIDTSASHDRRCRQGNPATIKGKRLACFSLVRST